MLPELTQVHTLIALRQSLTSLIAEQRQVGILHARKTQQTPKIYLLTSTLQQVSAPHHLSDSHQGIIHHHCKLISPCPIAPSYDEIAYIFFYIYGLLPIMLIVVSDDRRSGAQNNRRLVIVVSLLTYRSVSVS